MESSGSYLDIACDRSPAGRPYLRVAGYTDFDLGHPQLGNRSGEEKDEHRSAGIPGQELGVDRSAVRQHLAELVVEPGVGDLLLAFSRSPPPFCGPSILCGFL